MVEKDKENTDWTYIAYGKEIDTEETASQRTAICELIFYNMLRNVPSEEQEIRTYPTLKYRKLKYFSVLYPVLLHRLLVGLPDRSVEVELVNVFCYSVGV